MGDLTRNKTLPDSAAKADFHELIDTAELGVMTTQGDVLYRGASAAARLAAGSAGQALTTGGAGANPAWAGMTTQGDVEYHNGTTRTRLAAGTAGQALITGGASANASWGGMTTGGDVEYHNGTTRTRLAKGTAGQVFKINSGATAPEWSSDTACLQVVIDDGTGVTIGTGVKIDVEIPFNCTITQATLLADQSGSIVVDIWKDTYANYPPTDADSITASAPPTISSATKSQDTTLTGWTTALAAGSTLRINVDSCTTITRCTLSLKVAKT